MVQVGGMEISPTPWCVLGTNMAERAYIYSMYNSCFRNITSLSKRCITYYLFATVNKMTTFMINSDLQIPKFVCSIVTFPLLIQTSSYTFESISLFYFNTTHIYEIDSAVVTWQSK